MMNGWISIKELKWKCRVVDSVMVIRGGSGSPGNTRNEPSRYGFHSVSAFYIILRLTILSMEILTTPGTLTSSPDPGGKNG